MALITKPNTFTAGNTIIASEHNDNFDTIYNDYNGNITNANISASAAIVDTKFAQISTAGKVADSALPQLRTFDEQGSAPSTNANEGAIYTKESSSATELFFREESDGDEVLLTSGGGLNIQASVGTIATDGATDPEEVDVGFPVKFLLLAASNSTDASKFEAAIGWSDGSSTASISLTSGTESESQGSSFLIQSAAPATIYQATASFSGTSFTLTETTDGGSVHTIIYLAIG